MPYTCTCIYMYCTLYMSEFRQPRHTYIHKYDIVHRRVYCTYTCMYVPTSLEETQLIGCTHIHMYIHVYDLHVDGLHVACLDLHVHVHVHVLVCLRVHVHVSYLVPCIVDTKQVNIFCMSIEYHDDTL